MEQIGLKQVCKPGRSSFSCDECPFVFGTNDPVYGRLNLALY